MEFEDMKKIWDTQNNEPLYVINEAALNKRIQAKNRRANRTSNINDIGLIIIMLALAIMMPIIDEGSLYAFITSFIALIVATYISYNRYRRKRKAKNFDRSLLGELEVAIANTQNEIKRARTFIWWMLAPFSIPILLNLFQQGFPFWKWLFVIAAFILSYFVTQWGLKKHHIPRKQELEKLKELLIRE